MKAPVVSIMQPYFFPYAGYYRLIPEVDIFVIYDCVQFPRRGRVHRCQVSCESSTPSWLTLPLQKQPYDVRIYQLKYTENANQEFLMRLGKLPWMARPSNEMASIMMEQFKDSLEIVIDDLERWIKFVCTALRFCTPMIRSSTLKIPDTYKGEDRILEIMRRLGGNTYINSPGGYNLYSRSIFLSRGIELKILKPYNGSGTSILEDLIARPASSIGSRILSEISFIDD